MSLCDGPTLPQSDPSYPWCTGTVEIPDPEVLRSRTNQRGLPGDARQQQVLRAVTRIKIEGGEESEMEEGGNGGEDPGSEADREGGEDFGGGTARHSRGPGGSTPELRPRSGESVASAGGWGRSHQ
ncbi:hypothetical protein NDU88_003466 [Pleurodeles waltl]|uniref:Uncharacterized protein n=1 Tax=Pleurodeles waltl TaxID=8319 RepID=A0AAV7WVD9_PLEWA|nr:hypothetical protein NDU88_003466 [Pleurodeles waltl]